MNKRGLCLIGISLIMTGLTACGGSSSSTAETTTASTGIISQEQTVPDKTEGEKDTATETEKTEAPQTTQEETEKPEETTVDTGLVVHEFGGSKYTVYVLDDTIGGYTAHENFFGYESIKFISEDYWDTWENYDYDGLDYINVAYYTNGSKPSGMEYFNETVINDYTVYYCKEAGDKKQYFARLVLDDECYLQVTYSNGDENLGTSENLIPILQELLDGIIIVPVISE